MRQVIAIDGPSGAGKTTIAKVLARELGYRYLDTGALYRAAAVALIRNGIKPEDGDDKLGDVLRKNRITFSRGCVYLNDGDISEEIRSAEIDHYSSVFSARNIVRDFLMQTQRDAAVNSSLVVEGRDTTTVVFPDAEKKIYLDASVEERAKRRSLQFREKGMMISPEESLKNILDRDRRDSGRAVAPLHRAADALLIDSSNLTIEQVIKEILDFVRTDP